MKYCPSCEQEKPIEDFYAHPKTADGRMAICKHCHCEAVKKRRRENPSVQAYDRARAKTPERRAHAARISKQWRIDNPQAYKAQTAVGNAIRDGKLKKEPCEVCGALDVHAHHDDYSRPLEVRWRCPLHHHRHHAEAGPGENGV